MLTIRNLTAGYDGRAVVRAVNFAAQEGSITAILGPGGAGKTTLANAICGLLPVVGGQVIYSGAEITHIPLMDRIGRGISYVPSGLRLFAELTALENLRLCAQSCGRGFEGELDFVLSLFPELKPYLKAAPSKLSSSMQRTIMVARAVIRKPRLLVLDQPSFGLKGQELHKLFNSVAVLNREYGMAVLLFEQRTFQALKLAETALLLEKGRIAGEYRAIDLLADRAMQTDFLGGARLPVERAA
jgi:branched-chain amino acid transport system ATP-binding protein